MSQREWDAFGEARHGDPAKDRLLVQLGHSAILTKPTQGTAGDEGGGFEGIDGALGLGCVFAGRTVCVGRP